MAFSLSIEVNLSNTINFSFERITSSLVSTLKAEMFNVERTAKLDYLSGPRPEKLGVVTNVLRSGIRSEAFSENGRLFGNIGFGNQAWYGRLHEEGIGGRKKRAFLMPSIEEHEGAIRDSILGAINTTIEEMI